MKRIDYFIIYGILLSVGLFLLLYTEHEVFAGLFLGVFIAGIEKLIGIEHSQTRDVITDLSKYDSQIDKDLIDYKSKKL